MKNTASLWTWESYEGGAFGTHPTSDVEIEIAALQNAAQAAKWGERYTPGRAWYVTLPDGRILEGHSADLRAAKRDAVAAADAAEEVQA